MEGKCCVRVTNLECRIPILLVSGNTIVSGSTDRSLKVWNAETGMCEYTLYGHTSTVRCMHLHQDT